MLENIICFLFPSVTDSIYEQGCYDGSFNTAQLVCEHSETGRHIMLEIIDDLPED